MGTELLGSTGISVLELGASCRVCTGDAGVYGRRELVVGLLELVINTV